MDSPVRRPPSLLILDDRRGALGEGREEEIVLECTPLVETSSTPTGSIQPFGTAQPYGRSLWPVAFVGALAVVGGVALLLGGSSPADVVIAVGDFTLKSNQVGLALAVLGVGGPVVAYVHASRTAKASARRSRWVFAWRRKR